MPDILVNTGNGSAWVSIPPEHERPQYQVTGPWTEPEVLLLRVLYPRFGPEACHRVLRRSTRAITAKAFEMKLRSRRQIDAEGPKADTRGGVA